MSEKKDWPLLISYCCIAQKMVALYFETEVEGKRVVIGDGVWIEANTIILKGSVIPDKCAIGAGTLITEKNSKRLKSGDIIVNDVKLKELGNRRHY